MKKRLFCAALALCLIVSLFTVIASANNDSNSVYNQTQNQYYDSLEGAFLAAGNGNRIYISATQYTLTDSIEVPQGITLVVPTSSAMNDANFGNNAQGAVVSGSAYSTLVVPSGITLTVNGTLLVAGNQQSTQPKTGCLTGDYGRIDLGGELIVNGTLHARGDISGSGKVIVNSGATVNQMFQIFDWRGGTETQSAYLDDVFPFNRFEISNIKAETDYFKGSKLAGRYYIFASNTAKAGNVNIIGNGGLLNFDSSATSTDKITFSFDSPDEITATVHGPVSTGAITVSFHFLFWDINLSSTNQELPFGYNMDVVVADGGVLTLTNKIKLLPDCTLTVENGGTFNVANTGKLFVYDRAHYLNSYNFQTQPLPSDDAYLVNYGTINNSGVIASSDSTLSNIPYTSYSNTTTVYEYEQNVGTHAVTFYIGE